MSASSGQPSSEQHSKGRSPQQQRVPFTKEELAVLRECNSESFWYRCVPFGLAMMGGTQYLVNSGVLKPHPKYGALFKNLGGLLVGYIAGKMSYQNTCRQKIMERIPNSRLAQAMGQKGPFGSSNEMGSTPSGGTSESLPSLRDEMRSSDFDTDKTPTQTPKGLDDSQRPTLDKEGFKQPSSDAEEGGPEYRSYDDLRKQNRMEYDKKMASKDSPFNQRPWPPPAPPSSQAPLGEQGFGQGRPSWRAPRQERDTSGKPKNKYGDEWDE